MWKEYTVKMQFLDKLCGSVPQSKELIRSWLEARMPKTKPEGAEKSIDDLEEEVGETIDESMEKTTLGFQADDDGIFLRGGTIKAHLKDCANQIKDVVKVKNFRVKVANKVYIEDYKIHVYKDGDIAQEPDGSFDQPVHVMSRMGPRSALKNIQFLLQPEITFTLKILEDSEVKIKKVTNIFEYGGLHGYGGERGMGEGRYTFEISEK